MQKTIYCEEYSRLLEWLKERRTEQNLTMRQLAERLDVHHSWIGRVELGERRLDVMEFVRYCNALGANPCQGINRLANSDESGNLLAAESPLQQYSTKNG